MPLPFTSTAKATTVAATNTSSGATRGFVIAQSLDFDGVDDHVSLGTQLKALLDAATKFSMEVWFKIDTTIPVTGMILFQQENTDAGDSAHTRVALAPVTNTPRLEFIVRTTSGATYNLRTGTALSLDTWYHALCRYDGTTSGGLTNINIKSGGSDVGSQAQRTSVGTAMYTSSSNANARFGTTFKTTRAFDGHIALFRIWDEYIDDAAFTALHGSGVPPFSALSDNGDYDYSSDLQASWLMEDAGDTVTDESTNSYDGTKGASGFPANSTDVPL